MKKILTIIMIASLICFVNMSYAVVPTSEFQQYEGIDVSDWQGYIDYNKVRENGIEVVYIKASQGRNIKDAYFDINYENAKANGLKVGFYHFLTANNTRRSRTRSTIFRICNLRQNT